MSDFSRAQTELLLALHGAGGEMPWMDLKKTSHPHTRMRLQRLGLIGFRDEGIHEIWFLTETGARLASESARESA